MQNKLTQFQSLTHPGTAHVRTIVMSGICVLSLFVSMYVYFVGKIVFDVVAQRTAESSIKASQSEISALDGEYYNKIKTVTLADASVLGLSESKDILYASRAPITTTAFLTTGN